jgi:hypothetical protein
VPVLGGPAAAALPERLNTLLQKHAHKAATQPKRPNTLFVSEKWSFSAQKDEHTVESHPSLVPSSL